MTNQRETDAAEIGRTVAAMGPREVSVLRRIAERLLLGQKLYGKLTKGKKDWRREAQEEVFDLSVYMSALLEDLADG